MKGQDSFTYGRSRQWFAVATASNAGNHIAACESPTRATVRVPFGSP